MCLCGDMYGLVCLCGEHVWACVFECVGAHVGTSRLSRVRRVTFLIDHLPINVRKSVVDLSAVSSFCSTLVADPVYLKVRGTTGR